MASRLSRGVAAGATVALVGVLLVAVLAPMTGGRPPLDERTHEVASRLRCPTCVAESAADSASPVAESMRTEIRRQLAAGRSEEQVMTWFRARYGDTVVLEPDRNGVGWLFWAGPPIAVAVAAAVLIAVVRRRRVAVRGADAGALTTPRLVAALGIAAAASIAVPLLVVAGNGGTSPEAGAEPDDVTADASSPRAASPSAGRVGRAFELLRDGDPAAAERLVRPLAEEDHAGRPMPLLILGLAQRAQGEPAAARTLRAFVDRHPGHPAVPQVERLLAGSGPGR